jgi:hypothetical protein
VEPRRDCNAPIDYRTLGVPVISRRTLSEEISSRVAECTRLILVKDEFGGDLGALDRCVDGYRKNTGI